MARPIKSDRRDRQLNLKLTTGELGWVRERASESGMRPTEYGRAKVLADGQGVAVPDVRNGRYDRLWLTQLSRIGNNLNQVARRLNALRMPAPFDLAPLLKDIRAALAKGMRDDS